MPIWGVDGPPGSGKTAFAVTLCIKYADEGKRVFANIPLYDLRPGSPLFGFQWANYVETMGDLLDLSAGIVLIDECDAWFNSHEWKNITFDEKLFFTQHRKEQLNIVWCCTHIDRVLNIVRDITELQHRCQRWPFGYSLARVFNPLEGKSAKGASSWKVTKLSADLGRLYDTASRVRKGADGAGLVRGRTTAYGQGYNVRVGTSSELWEMAGGLSWRGFQKAEPGEDCQWVSPLLPLSEVYIVADRIRAVYRGEGSGVGGAVTGSDKVAAKRLTPFAQRLMGKDWRARGVAPSNFLPIVSIEPGFSATAAAN